MLGLDLYVVIIFSLFILSHKTRATSLVLLFAYVLHYGFALDYHGLARYLAIATVDVLAGCYLIYFSKRIFFKHQDIFIAATYFLLIPINVAGGFLYWGYYPKEHYDNMCKLIIILQIMILSWRVLKGGRIADKLSSLLSLCGITSVSVNKWSLILQSKKAKSQKA